MAPQGSGGRSPPELGGSGGRSPPEIGGSGGRSPPEFRGSGGRSPPAGHINAILVTISWHIGYHIIAYWLPYHAILVTIAWHIGYHSMAILITKTWQYELPYHGILVTIAWHIGYQKQNSKSRQKNENRKVLRMKYSIAGILS